MKASHSTIFFPEVLCLNCKSQSKKKNPANLNYSKPPVKELARLMNRLHKLLTYIYPSASSTQSFVLTSFSSEIVDQIDELCPNQ